MRYFYTRSKWQFCAITRNSHNRETQKSEFQKPSRFNPKNSLQQRHNLCLQYICIVLFLPASSLNFCPSATLTLRLFCKLAFMLEVSAFIPAPMSARRLPTWSMKFLMLSVLSTLKFVVFMGFKFAFSTEPVPTTKSRL